MKSRLYILAVLMFCPLYSLAQKEASNYLKDTNTWVIVTDNNERNGADAVNYYCYIYGDSIINGIKYQKFHITKEPPYSVLYWVSYDSILCYREEGNRIYHYDNTIGKEVLDYEFNLNGGDETLIGDGKRVKVSEVFPAKDIVDICTIDTLKAYRINGIDDDSYNDIWLDGVGSIYTGLLPRVFFTTENPTDMIYSPTVSKCRFTAYDKVLPVNLDKYNLGSDDNLHVDFEFIDDTLHISGISAFDLSSVYLFQCHLHGQTITMDAIPTYFYSSIVDTYMISKYDIKYPGFDAGVYNISIKPSRWKASSFNKDHITLTCHGFATDINVIKTSALKQNDNAIYNLSGRRMNAIPEQGIYIQGGKKMIK